MDRDAQNAWIERVLGIALPTAADGPSLGGGVAFAKLRLSWDDARKHLGRQLIMLRDAIVAQAAEEEDFAEIETGAGEIQEVLANLDDGLSDALDDLYNAGGGDVRLRRTARSLVASYRSYLDSEPLLQELDTNPFVPLDARKRLDNTLSSIMARLQE